MCDIGASRHPRFGGSVEDGGAGNRSANGQVRRELARELDLNRAHREPQVVGAEFSLAPSHVTDRDDAHMLMQVHDELVFEVRADAVETVQAAVTELMCGAAKLLPVAVITPPSDQATSTSIPGAPNSTGGCGL